MRERVLARQETKVDKTESNDVDLELPHAPSEVSLTPTEENKPILRRSTRVTQKPSWSKDYVSQ